MDAFSYLSVLISVIQGLAITQVLQGYRSLALARTRLRGYWPSIAWSGIVIAVAVQNWWALFGLAGRSDWSFAAFAAILIHSGLIYMMAALVLPDADESGAIDLRAHYYREVPAFFGTVMILSIWSGVREMIVEEHFLQGANLAFHVIFLLLSGAAIAIRRPRFHEALAGIVAILFAAYVAMLFARLG